MSTVIQVLLETKSRPSQVGSPNPHSFTQSHRASLNNSHYKLQSKSKIKDILVNNFIKKYYPELLENGRLTDTGLIDRQLRVMRVARAEVEAFLGSGQEANDARNVAKLEAQMLTAVKQQLPMLQKPPPAGGLPVIKQEGVRGTTQELRASSINAIIRQQQRPASIDTRHSSQHYASQ
jgi:hypothetical protein